MIRLTIVHRGQRVAAFEGPLKLLRCLIAARAHLPCTVVDETDRVVYSWERVGRLTTTVEA